MKDDIKEILIDLADKVMFRQMDYYKDSNVCQDVCRDKDSWVIEASEALFSAMISCEPEKKASNPYGVGWKDGADEYTKKLKELFGETDNDDGEDYSPLRELGVR